MAINRRAALAGLAAGSLLTVGAGPPPRLRRSVSSLSPQDPDLAALRKAIPLMRAAGVWDAQIALHADMRERHHSSWRFLPWHRLQLHWFERQVARFSGRAAFALPYWDWDDDRIPPVMASDPVLALPGRAARPNDSIKAFMARNGRSYGGRMTDDFDTFFGRRRNVGTPAQGGYSGSAEWSGHNMLHGFVGGEMGRLDRAPNDPLFWMHHANIDRIWTQWAQKNPDAVHPKPWRDEAFTGFFDTARRRAPTVTAASTLATAAFGYAYETDPTPVIVFAAPPRKVLKVASEAWQADILTPQSAILDIPAAAAGAGRGTATGFLDVKPDPEAASVVTLRVVDQRDGFEFHRDAVFLVPSGACEAEQGFRIRLDQVFARSGVGDVRIHLNAAPLDGRGAQTATTLLRFILDAEVTWLE